MSDAYALKFLLLCVMFLALRPFDGKDEDERGKAIQASGNAIKNTRDEEK